MTNRPYATMTIIEEMIQEAVLAGAYHITMRQDPRTAGFERLRAQHSRRAAELADVVAKRGRK